MEERSTTQGLRLTARVFSFCVGASLLSLAGCFGGGGGSDDLAGSSAPAPSADGRYLVRYRSAPGAGALRSRVAAVGSIEQAVRQAVGEGSRIEPVVGNLYAVELPRTTSESEREQAVERLRWSAEIEAIEPDYVVRTLAAPNDPLFSQQWAHTVVQSTQAWDIGQGSHEVIVAVIDSGVDHRHADLTANIWNNPREVAGNGRDDDGNGLIDDVVGWDFVNNDPDPTADDAPTYHGTHCAGIIGGVGGNGLGVSGHSPRVKLMPLKFIASNGLGNISAAIRSIEYAVANGARIISNSWGGPQASHELAAAIDRARQRGVLFIAAAGNGGQDGIGDDNDSMPNYPSNYPSDNVLAVAATDRSDNLTRFSNYGVRTVHIAAPGEQILSTQNGGGYQNLSGTSMATPLVAGVAAMMLALDPSLTYAQLKQKLMDSSDRPSGLTGRVASGRVNALRALQSVQGTDPGPGPSPTPQPTPTPSPTSTPTPQPTLPPPSQGVAQAPLIGGMPRLVVNNPYFTIPIDYDVSSIPGAFAALIEVTRPGFAFTNPNGDFPDPMRFGASMVFGARGRLLVFPAQQLPGWGFYQFRVIALDPQGRLLGRFSNSALLELRPF